MSEGVPPERTALYRIRGEADALLYIGISKDFGKRWKTEARTFPWWEEHRGMTVEWHESRPEAEAAEEAAIKAEKPKYNKQHARPVSAQRPKRYRSERADVFNKWAGTLVRDLREAQGMPQRVLADEMRLQNFPWHQATVCAVEAGRRDMLFSEVLAIIEIFGISVESLTAPWEPVRDWAGNVICEPIVPFPGGCPSSQVTGSAA